MNFQIYRHGDVALVPAGLTDKINSQFRIRKSAQDVDGKHILAYGEATGHYHAVSGVNVMADSGGLILEVPEGGTGLVQHLGYSGPREHNDIELPPGRYVPVQQHEYNITDGWRAVMD